MSSYLVCVKSVKWVFVTRKYKAIDCVNGMCVIKTLNTFITYTVFPTTGMLYSVYYLYFHDCTKRCM